MLKRLDGFGYSVATLGDLDNDGIVDIAVGATGDDDGGDGLGAVWLLFLNNNGTVKGHQKISATEGGFNGMLENGDGFGSSVASLGDLDNDGIVDIAVGAIGDDDGGNDAGAVWIVSPEFFFTPLILDPRYPQIVIEDDTRAMPLLTGANYTVAGSSYVTV